MTTAKNGKGKKMLVMILMILSLCTIYVLPYLRYQYFTPLQEAMGLVGENQKYGNLVSVYGIMNVLMYLPGGIIADKFDPKKLLVFSMVSSGALGLWMATWPGYEILLLIHVLWGITTVLTFWSSSIKVVNMLAAADEQGSSFSILEGGRGIVGICLNALWLAVFAALANHGNLGMTVVVSGVSTLMIIAGVLLALLLPKSDMSKAVNSSVKDSLKALVGAFKLPITWVLSAMIFVPSALGAAGSYWAPYLQGACGMSVVMASTFAVVRGDGCRIIGSGVSGIVTKKMGRSSFWLMVGTTGLAVFGALLLFVPATPATLWPIMIIMIGSAFFFATMRAVNWAVIEEAGTPKNMVGGVIGVASLVGYLPDTFIHNLFGGWLDNLSFDAAYNRIFLFCLITAIVGIGFAFVGERIIKKRMLENKQAENA